MVQVEIVDKVFNDAETGQIIPYKRLAISGILGGNKQTVEMKVGKTEAQFIQALLDSKEEKPKENESFLD